MFLSRPRSVHRLNAGMRKAAIGIFSRAGVAMLEIAGDHACARALTYKLYWLIGVHVVLVSLAEPRHSSRSSGHRY